MQPNVSPVWAVAVIPGTGAVATAQAVATTLDPLLEAALEGGAAAARSAFILSARRGEIEKGIAEAEHALNGVQGLLAVKRQLEQEVEDAIRELTETKDPAYSNEAKRKERRVERLKAHEYYQALLLDISSVERRIIALSLDKARIGRDWYVCATRVNGFFNVGLHEGKF